jgi:hypothetical protein
MYQLKYLISNLTIMGKIDVQSNYTHEQFNKQILDIKHNQYLIRIFKQNGRNKYALIRNELALCDNKGNLPRYGIQGEDFTYHYKYGKFINTAPLTKKQIDYIYNNFHTSGRVVFGENITHMIIYKNEEDISQIEDARAREIVLKLFNDVRNSELRPYDDGETNFYPN